MNQITFPTGAIRENKTGKGMPSQIPPIALDLLSKHCEQGAIKHGKGNCTKGLPLSSFIDAIFRHYLKCSQGIKDEGEYTHFTAIMWNAAMMIWTLEQIKLGRLPKELNDLPYWQEQKITVKQCLTTRAKECDIVSE